MRAASTGRSPISSAARNRFISQRPERDTTPTGPFLWMARHDADLDLSA